LISVSGSDRFPEAFHGTKLKKPLSYPAETESNPRFSRTHLENGIFIQFPVAFRQRLFSHVPLVFFQANLVEPKEIQSFKEPRRDIRKRMPTFRIIRLFDPLVD
jgi:hypothetical protein